MISAVQSIRMLAVALVLGTAATIAIGAWAATSHVNVNNGYAVHGYDVVAYFTKGTPTEGDDRFTAVHNGATYRFSSADHRDMFNADPARFEPAYGGYCAFGTAMGRKFDGDPHAWSIVDGTLYLNLNRKVQSRWMTDTEGFIRGADNNWPIIRDLTDAELAAAAPAGLTRGAI